MKKLTLAVVLGLVIGLLIFQVLLLINEVAGLGEGSSIWTILLRILLVLFFVVVWFNLVRRYKRME